MSNGKSDDDVVLEYSGSRALYAIPRLVQGHSNQPPVHYTNPTLIPKIRSEIDHDWALLSFVNFYVFDEVQHIHGEKLQIVQRTESL